MNAQEASLFIAFPVRDGRVHLEFVHGLIDAVKGFSGRVVMEANRGGFLPRARDILTAQFLRSPCSHMLCVDTDVGWTAADAQALLDSGKDFVSGCYSKRQDKPEIPAKLTGVRDAQNPDLWEATYVPGGFVLVARAVVERMVGAYHHLQYKTKDGTAWALWAELFGDGSYDGEDIAFCKRWRQIGGQIWLHQGVHLPHVGERVYRLDDGPKAP